MRFGAHDETIWEFDGESISNGECFQNNPNVGAFQPILAGRRRGELIRDGHSKVNSSRLGIPREGDVVHVGIDVLITPWDGDFEEGERVAAEGSEFEVGEGAGFTVVI